MGNFDLIKRKPKGFKKFGKKPPMGIDVDDKNTKLGDKDVDDKKFKFTKRK